MRDVVRAVLTALLASACDAPATPATPAPRPAPSAARTLPAVDHAARLRPWLARQDPMPKRHVESPCPDHRLRSLAPDDAQRTLILRVQDDRYERKSLLPLRATRHLVAPYVRGLDGALLRVDSSPRGAPLAPELASQLDALDTRRFVGVFHVVDHAGPRLIHRIDRARPEWVAGWLVSWLVIHDARSGEPLCTARVVVKNDTRDASTAARARSATTEALTDALGATARRDARTALARISSVLTMPELEPPAATSVARL